MQYRVEKCVQGGNGLIRLEDGSVCFVDAVLPNELIEINITQQKKDFAKAVATKILEPHKSRREAPCKYYNKCGGCNAQYMQFDFQIEILKQIVLDLFLRTAKLCLPQDFEIYKSSEWNYRARAKIFIDKNSKWGFKARNSNAIIPIENCPVLTKELNETINKLPKQNKKVIRVFDNQSEKFLGKHIYANEKVFFQSNLELLSKLITHVLQAAGEGELLLDIFCGVGLFSVFLQNKFKQIIAIEQNILCKEFAQKNLAENCKFIAMSAEDWCKKNINLLKNACILIDPPREGISKELCEIFCRHKPKKLIYVSCEPSTLARDTQKLLNANYKLESIQGFAFYPQTFHLEMLAVFN